MLKKATSIEVLKVLTKESEANHAKTRGKLI